MDKDEIQLMIDESISREIKNHEIRVGWISGIIGIFFCIWNCPFDMVNETMGELIIFLLD